MAVLSGVLLVCIPVLLAGAQDATPDPVPLAILDTGIDPHHREFGVDQVVAWRDFVNGRPLPYDDEGHGTGVASRAAGLGVMDLPASGAPGQPLVVAKVVDAQGFTSWPLVARALRWAVDDGGARVVSVSIWDAVPQVGTSDATVVRDAIRHATERGVLVVWIAGSSPAIPSEVLVGSNSPDALVVGAAYADGRPVSPTASKPVPESGLDPELVAWGLDVPVAAPGNATARGSGSSFAAPYVAGVAAAVQDARAARGLQPLTPWGLERVLLTTSDDHAETPYALEGYGLVNRTRALEVGVGDDRAPSRGFDTFVHSSSDLVRRAVSLSP